MQIALNIPLEIIIKKQIKNFWTANASYSPEHICLLCPEKQSFPMINREMFKNSNSFFVKCQKVSCAIQSGLFLESLSNTSPVLIKSWPKIPAGVEEGFIKKYTSNLGRGLWQGRALKGASRGANKALYLADSHMGVTLSRSLTLYICFVVFSI